MVEVRFHLSVSACPAIPMDGHHAKLRRQYRLRRHGTRRHVRFDRGHENARPFAELVRIRWHSPDPDLDLCATVQTAEAKLRLVSRASGMPGRAILVQLPLDRIGGDFDCRVVRGLRDRAPRGCGQTVRIAIRAYIGISLHDQSERRFRHAMVTVRRGGRAALAAGQRGATGDALDFLRLSDGCIVFDVVQGDAGG